MRRLLLAALLLAGCYDFSPFERPFDARPGDAVAPDGPLADLTNRDAAADDATMAADAAGDALPADLVTPDQATSIDAPVADAATDAAADLAPAPDLRVPGVDATPDAPDLAGPPDLATPGIKPALFLAAPTYAARTNPYHAVAIDYDQDKKTDRIAVANYGDNSVSILLVKGGGALETGQTLAVGVGPILAASADFNGDKFPDLAVVNYVAKTVSILLADQGGGYLVDPKPFTIGGSTLALVAGDVNGDGMADLVHGFNSGGGQIAVRLGNGDGTFKAAISFLVLGGGTPYGLALANLDNDLNLDLVIGGYPFNGYTMQTFTGTGDGHFTSVTILKTGGTPSERSVATGDWNGDGKIDVASTSDDYVRVYLGQGNGAIAYQAAYAATPKPADIVSGDWNGDGKLDLATHDTDSGVVLLLGDGKGLFTPANRYIAGARANGALLTTDLDSDGKSDLVVSNYDAGTIAVLLGVGDGTFKGGDLYPHDGPSLVAGQMIGDQEIDLAVSTGNLIQILQGMGKGRFVAKASTDVKVVTGALGSGDLDGNGFADLVVAVPGGARVVTNNMIGVPQLQMNSYPVAGSSGVLVAAIDGAPLDALVASSLGDTVTPLLGMGDGSFTAKAAANSGKGPQAIVAADFSGDGKLDLAAANEGGNSVSVLLGNANGTFQVKADYAVGTAPRSLAVADVNGDGKLDLLVANRMSGDVSLLLGGGDGTFQAQKRIMVGVTPEAIAAIDLQGDKKIDLAVGGATQITVLVGLGDGTFMPSPSIALPGVLSLIARDLDGDGKPELATVGKPGGVAVFKNLSP